ncbi:histone-lysine N-methyltransferase SETDB1-B-like [Antennarius striatus]|uniref:histone-lysine N-methyltransferase SETDB1-B-like n=1 Tax=Antennarius striatus TaxID=241820 RepID=UPI0035AD94F6
MEGDEMEMSREELQKWIRGKVKKHSLLLNVQDKCKLLHSLLERRQKRASLLLKLCESVFVCEAVVKKQYALLGWEYKDTDSGSPPAPLPQSAHDEAEVPGPAATNGSGCQLKRCEGSENQRQDDDSEIWCNPEMQPVVVLTRLPPPEIRSFYLSAPPDQEPPKDSGHVLSPRLRKRRKKEDMDVKCPELPETSKSSGAESEASKPSTPRARGTTKARSNAKKTPENTEGLPPPVCAPDRSTKSTRKTKHSPCFTQEQITINMNVLARRVVGWQKGKVLGVITKDDGRRKYKIAFKDKGRSLISGHHIAFERPARADQMFVGARVVVECGSREPCFVSGVVAELACNNNLSRFMVFLDDRTSLYVNLSALHLVCRPLPNCTDDIVDEAHKNFVKEFVESGPKTRLKKYKVGNIVFVELNGVVQKCEVQAVDCNVIQVFFQRTQQKEWIYRCSARLNEDVYSEEQTSGRPSQSHHPSPMR